MKETFDLRKPLSQIQLAGRMEKRAHESAISYPTQNYDLTISIISSTISYKIQGCIRRPVMTCPIVSVHELKRRRRAVTASDYLHQPGCCFLPLQVADFVSSPKPGRAPTHNRPGSQADSILRPTRFPSTSSQQSLE